MDADDDKCRKRGGFHAHGQTGDDVRAVAGEAGLGNGLNRPELLGRIILGDPDDEARQGQTDQGRAEDAHGGKSARCSGISAELTDEPLRNEEERDGGKDT